MMGLQGALGGGFTPSWERTWRHVVDKRVWGLQGAEKIALGQGLYWRVGYSGSKMEMKERKLQGN